ncbi:hypothetical protein K437DRAFT_253890 [Tilletiaria anomala UBC 951]|uniref:Ribosomal RNA-processing protein 17 n=1 Tax=Tilletiaria anomala (strain ATCC 24038 / CBS 436.72 / UBC 951) TaxID=1037660 RepID=A0A066WPZ2_TILAU|nr:uncharacterized protein K437DRAFT_253890 [Tilletiaria anomala UBC 951]KDN52695.1 hypothetical protein K437DRAFT_253890 [Tilletiaria anomala UBC 951]
MDAPLQAYTESSQRNGRTGPSAHKSKGKGKGKGKASSARPAGPIKYSRSARRVNTVTFDDAARAEYLSGFHKRKVQRKEKARKYLEEQKKIELKENRREAREARKEQAKENVKAERALFGDAYEGGLGEEEDGKGGNEVTPEGPEEEYDSDQHFTSVVVQDWDPDADPDDAGPSKNAAQPVLTSSNDPAKRRKNGREHKTVPPAKPATAAISDLIEPEAESILREADQILSQHQAHLADASSSSKPKAFHYETAAERAANRLKVREKRAKQAAKRKEENREALKAGSKKGSSKLKKAGKRGKGGIGSGAKKKASKS